MRFSLKALKLKHKLLLIIAIAAVGIAGMAVDFLVSYRGRLMNEKRVKTRHVVETAYGILEHYHKLSLEGAVPERDAKASAIKAINTLRYEEREYFWINDMRPVMVTHPVKPELNGKDLSDFRDPEGTRLFVEFVTVVKKSNAGFVSYLWPKPGSSKPVPKISYVKGFSPWGWIIGSGIYVDDVNTAFVNQAFRVIVVSLLVLSFMTVISYLVARSILRPVHEAVAVSNRVADGDLTVCISSGIGDETGQLLEAMGKMVVKLKDVVADVQSSAHAMASASQELSASSEQMSRGITEQAGRASQIASASTEMSQTVTDVARNASEIAASAGKTASIAAEGEAIVGKSVEEVRLIADTVSESSGLVASLGERSKQIGEIVSVIRDIADQTNLLALNAAIEAARAGEQGRGFAVVADEVRKLAERTSKATSEIGQMIKAIQDGVEKAVASMKEGTTRVDAGVELSARAGSALTGIVTSVSELQSMVHQIATATEEMSTTSEHISSDIETIAGVSKETSLGADQVAHAASDIARLATGLQAAVSRFRVDSRTP